MQVVQQLKQSADDVPGRDDGEDLAFCRISFADGQGPEDLFHPHTVRVQVQGAGALAALGSAAPASEERYDADICQTYDGVCLAVLRAGEAAGTLQVTISAEDGTVWERSISVEAEV